MLIKKSVTIMSFVYLLVLFIAGTIIFGTVAFTAHEPDHVPGPPSDTENPIDDLQSQIASNDDDIADLENRISLIEQSLLSNNQPPIVDAGTDQQIMISQIADLPGISTDDDLLLPLTTTWSQISGPGNALFVDPFSPVTQVQFDQTGTYELQLNAFDGFFSPSDNVIIEVFVDNDPPLVDAGENQILVGTPAFVPRPILPGGTHTLTCTAQLAGTATDDDLPQPLTTTWAKTGGFGHNITAEITDPTSLITDVTIVDSKFGLAGSVIDEFHVIFTLEVSDGFHTVSDTVQFFCVKP